MQFPSKVKREYFIWSYPALKIERRSWKSATAWASQNIPVYRDSSKFYPSNIFSSRLIEPRTDVDRFHLELDHAVMEAAIATPRNPCMLFGKWLLRADKEEIDEIWGRIDCEIGSGKLPYRAKVSTARRNPALKNTPKGKHLVCVYTPNYLWRDDVRAARIILRKLGFDSRLYYRPDVITILELGSVAGTDFDRDIFMYLRRYGVKRPVINYRYYG